ncbi:hypothetical protein BU16DRAFT_543541 [Lophium mytilinum]|uniref:Uncharacterized protein n=1 Tax=Lophium mytilinum TaxID=390894 RepID=A0A6A6QD46_9PEZI|nr:hypothetical protein BU16DRAFT_543541 [Lophium mytilinum]
MNSAGPGATAADEPGSTAHDTDSAMPTLTTAKSTDVMPKNLRLRIDELDDRKVSRCSRGYQELRQIARELKEGKLNISMRENSDFAWLVDEIHLFHVDVLNRFAEDDKSIRTLQMWCSKTNAAINRLERQIKRLKASAKESRPFTRDDCRALFESMLEESRASSQVNPQTVLVEKSKLESIIDRIGTLEMASSSVQHCTKCCGTESTQQTENYGSAEQDETFRQAQQSQTESDHGYQSEYAPTSPDLENRDIQIFSPVEVFRPDANVPLAGDTSENDEADQGNHSEIIDLPAKEDHNEMRAVEGVDPEDEINTSKSLDDTTALESQPQLSDAPTVVLVPAFQSDAPTSDPRDASSSRDEPAFAHDDSTSSRGSNALDSVDDAVTEANSSQPSETVADDSVLDSQQETPPPTFATQAHLSKSHSEQNAESTETAELIHDKLEEKQSLGQVFTPGLDYASIDNESKNECKNESESDDLFSDGENLEPDTFFARRAAQDETTSDEGALISGEETTESPEDGQDHEEDDPDQAARRKDSKSSCKKNDEKPHDGESDDSDDDSDGRDGGAERARVNQGLANTQCEAGPISEPQQSTSTANKDEPCDHGGSTLTSSISSHDSPVADASRTHAQEDPATRKVSASASNAAANFEASSGTLSNASNTNGTVTPSGSATLFGAPAPASNSADSRPPNELEATGSGTARNSSENVANPTQKGLILTAQKSASMDDAENEGMELDHVSDSEEDGEEVTMSNNRLPNAGPPTQPGQASATADPTGPSTTSFTSPPLQASLPPFDAALLNLPSTQPQPSNGAADTSSSEMEIDDVPTDDPSLATSGGSSSATLTRGSSTSSTTSQVSFANETQWQALFVRAPPTSASESGSNRLHDSSARETNDQYVEASMDDAEERDDEDMGEADTDGGSSLSQSQAVVGTSISQEPAIAQILPPQPAQTPRKIPQCVLPRLAEPLAAPTTPWVPAHPQLVLANLDLNKHFVHDRRQELDKIFKAFSRTATANRADLSAEQVVALARATEINCVAGGEILEVYYRKTKGQLTQLKKAESNPAIWKFTLGNVVKWTERLPDYAPPTRKATRQAYPGGNSGVDVDMEEEVPRRKTEPIATPAATSLQEPNSDKNIEMEATGDAQESGNDIPIPAQLRPNRIGEEGVYRLFPSYERIWRLHCDQLPLRAQGLLEIYRAFSQTNSAQVFDGSPMFSEDKLVKCAKFHEGEAVKVIGSYQRSEKETENDYNREIISQLLRGQAYIQGEQQQRLNAEVREQQEARLAAEAEKAKEQERKDSEELAKLRPVGLNVDHLQVGECLDDKKSRQDEMRKYWIARLYMHLQAQNQQYPHEGAPLLTEDELSLYVLDREEIVWRFFKHEYLFRRIYDTGFYDQVMSTQEFTVPWEWHTKFVLKKRDLVKEFHEFASLQGERRRGEEVDQHFLDFNCVVVEGTRKRKIGVESRELADKSAEFASFQVERRREEAVDPSFLDSNYVVVEQTRKRKIGGRSRETPDEETGL